MGTAAKEKEARGSDRSLVLEQAGECEIGFAPIFSSSFTRRCYCRGNGNGERVHVNRVPSFATLASRNLKMSSPLVLAWSSNRSFLFEILIWNVQKPDAFKTRVRLAWLRLFLKRFWLQLLWSNRFSVKRKPFWKMFDETVYLYSSWVDRRDEAGWS